jgi:hypothetical protein
MANQLSADAMLIIDELPNLTRSSLEAIATAALSSSNEAVWAAEDVVPDFKEHCLRCHEDFDPDDLSDCKMEEHDEGLFEADRIGRNFTRECCLKSERSNDYCWVGSHVAD